MKSGLVYSVRADFSFKWYDIWLGVYVDVKERYLYICPLPCCCFRFYLYKGPRRPLWDVFIEYWIVIATANALAFIIVSIMTLINHREEVVAIIQNLVR